MKIKGCLWKGEGIGGIMYINRKGGEKNEK